jgi:hypothetical protein
MANVPWSMCADGIRIAVRLTPKSHGDSLNGITLGADGRALLAASVRAVPEKGAANDALVGLLARRLEVSRSSVVIERGGSARLKSLRVTGDPRMLGTTLSRLFGVATADEMS